MTIVFVLISQIICAQCDLVFEGKRVVAVCIADYSLNINEDSCTFQYNDHQIISHELFYDSNSYVYKEFLQEMQYLLNEIDHNRVPTVEDLEIDTVVLKKQFNRDLIQKKYSKWFLKPDRDACMYILERFQSLAMLTAWLQESYPILDSGVFVINTAHDSRGIKVVVKTDMKTYYFDMRDIEIFQPYMMRTSAKDCLRFITNFNINKHIRNLFKLLNIHREIPWRDEVIESYIRFCAEEYKYRL